MKQCALCGCCVPYYAPSYDDKGLEVVEHQELDTQRFYFCSGKHLAQWAYARWLMNAETHGETRDA